MNQTDELNALRAFVRQIAKMTKDGEVDPHGEDSEPFVMENDDNFETLGNLIEEARKLTGLRV